MSFANLTPIRPGMTGTFEGRRYRVAGRIVLGMEQDGETYYWNEFHLVAPDGDEATLVHEVTDDGVTWRFFTAFEPQKPMSASEAAAACAGQTVELDGRPLRVTLVDESRVYHVEGSAPEGVEVGDVARYFNAADGQAMVVVSWTGDEVEFFRGYDLPRGTVARAFGISSEGREPAPRSAAAGLSFPAPSWVPKLVLAVLGVAVLFGFFSCRSTRRMQTARPVPLIKAAAPPLQAGFEGSLDGTAWRVARPALVEVSEVGQRFEQHEYELRDREGAQGLLVFSSKPGTKNALHLLAFQPEKALTATEAATNRLGDTVDFDGITAKVASLARAKVVQANGELPSGGTGGGVLLYGFTAEAGSTVFLVRWTDAGITLYRGKASPAAELVKKFGPGGNP